MSSSVVGSSASGGLPRVLVCYMAEAGQHQAQLAFRPGEPMPPSTDRLFRWTVDLPIALVVLSVSLWRIGTPSLWRDEAATASAAESGWRAILQTSRDVDAVHAAFYLLEWLWTSFFGASEISLRLPSALAITASAVFLTALARLYTTELNSVLCTALFVLMPATTRYAQEAREAALVIMLAVLSTLALHIAARRGVGMAWVAYGTLLVLIPPFNLVASYILLTHLLFALYSKRAKTWCIAAAPTVLVASVMAAMSYSQRSTMLDVFVGPLSVHSFVAYADTLFGTRAIATVFVLIASVFVALAVYRKRVMEYSWLLAMAILPLPLWAVSHLQNVFLFRYGLYALPFFALISVLTLRRWYLICACIVLLAVLSMPIHVGYRAANGHGDDFRSVYADVDREAMRGDAIVVDGWLVRTAKDYYLQSALSDPLDPHGTTSDAIRATGGTPCTPESLERYQRVWFVRLSHDQAEQRPSECDPQLALVSSRKYEGSLPRYGNIVAELYLRN